MTIRQSRGARLGLALLLLAAAGCGEDFDPASYLQDARVLAAWADPPEVGPGQTLTLRSAVYVPPERAVVSERWTFCPFTAGPAAGYACVVPECETELAPDATGGAVTADPSALVLACAAALAANGDEPEGVPTGPDALPESVEVFFRQRVELDDGFVREAMVRVPLATRAAPADPNRHPVIVSLRIGERAVDLTDPPQDLPAVAPDDELDITVEVDPASLDTYVDEADRERVEEPIVSFFATAGRFEVDRQEGTTAVGEWKAEELEDDQSEALFYAVARDLRGGQAVVGPFRVPITR